MTIRIERIGSGTYINPLGKTHSTRASLERLRGWISKYVGWDENALSKDPYWPRMWVNKDDK